MAITKEGAIKVAAKKAGISVAEYTLLKDQGLHRCTTCKQWKPSSLFNNDASRHNGLVPSCRDCQRMRSRSKYVISERTIQKGRRFVEARSGDRLQARRRVNYLVEQGLLANPNTLPCYDCNHIGNEKRHEYDHYMGYGQEHQECVQVVCVSCHKKRTHEAVS